jgi:hypothetical protein
MSNARWIPLLLVAVLPLAACDGEPDEFEDAPATGEFRDAPDATMAPPPRDEATLPAEEAVAARQIAVTNPMPHPMVVTATVDGETVQIGTVPAGGTADLTVQARAGATVQLEARDEPDTHRVQGTVTVGETRAVWTIEQ